MKRSQPITEAKAKTMFQRTLNGWVTDSLRLGRNGLERPCARAGMDLSRRSLWSIGNATAKRKAV